MQNRTLIALMAGFLLCGAAQPAMAQGEPENIARTFVLDPKPGMVVQFEEALKTHMAWRAQHNDPWNWTTFAVVNGDNLGQYFVRSGNHQWSDLDEYEGATVSTEGAHFNTTVGPYLESISSNITQLNSNLSRVPEDLSSMTLYSVVTYDVRLPAQFFEAFAKAHEAIGQTDYPIRYILQTVVNGGLGGAILVVPAENWAAFAPPERTVPQMLTEALGAEDAADLLQQFATSIRSAVSSTVRIRPDLSSGGQ